MKTALLVRIRDQAYPDIFQQDFDIDDEQYLLCVFLGVVLLSVHLPDHECCPRVVYLVWRYVEYS